RVGPAPPRGRHRGPGAGARVRPGRPGRSRRGRTRPGRHAHPAVPVLPPRAVAGLTPAEIARACLVPEATMAQRISRAKQRIKASGAHFRLPPDAEWADRLAVVLHVLYLVFNEGYTATSGPDLQRPDLTAEAIRLTRAGHRALPDDGELAGP